MFFLFLNCLDASAHRAFYFLFFTHATKRVFLSLNKHMNFRQWFENQTPPMDQRWQMPRAEFDQMFPDRDLRKTDYFHIPVGNNFKVEIIKNPKTADYRAMSQEHRKEYPNAPKGDPYCRVTYDSEGNMYIWRSGHATHHMIEPAIERMFGTKVHQNEYFVFDSHRNLVRKALKDRLLSPTQYQRMHAKDYGPLEQFAPWLNQ